ncbi:hypothetical protein [Microvirga brassicacearum]|uniref:DUF748 domain-containing protein n=1 Tax=Microvirga brassicacearum TaxID=2580413 RepID=A0A5N3PIF3_9HYPH|nr:hypothetical protein [Microvirga brassicacearum]KAB0269516.1 hypothetical protein FEZ63_01040 [Microvirga brassicacearum]
MRRLYRPALCALALFAGAAVLRFEPAIVSNLALDRNGPQVTVGSVKVPLWNAAFAQSAESVTLENVRFTSGGSTYEAARIEISGLASSRADLDALLASTSSEPLETRLARISAKQVVAPSLKSTRTIGPQTQTITYKNVVFRDVVRGRVAEATADTAGAETTEGRDQANFSYGRTSVSDLELPALARLYETRAAAGPNPLVKIHGAFSIDNVDLVDGKEGVQFKIARISGRDFMARTISESWLGATTLFAELAGKDEMTADEQSRLIATTADFFGAFDIAHVEATGFEMKRTRPSPGPSAKIARMSYSGPGSRPAEVRIEGLEFNDQSGRFSLASASLTGFSIAPTLEGLKKLQGKSLDAFEAVDARSLAPTLGTLKLSGIALDTSVNGNGGRTTKLSSTVKEVEFTADQPVNNVPTNLRWAVQNFAVTLPEDSKEDGVKELRALGYRDLDLSFAFAGRWNEAANEIAVTELSLQGKDMATISLTGLFGSVSKEIFDADEAIATVALMGAKAKALDVTLENRGLFERFLAKTAREEKTTPDKLRQTYGAGAAFVVPSLIGHSEQATTISRAIARFVAKPGRLIINARAKDASGLGIVEILSLSDPKAALEKLDVTAVAE